MNKGFTLVEMAVGIAVTAMIGLIIAGLFKAGIQSYRYSLRQTLVLANARKAIDGDGGARGLIWSGQEAQATSDLSADGVTLNLPTVASRRFLVANQALFQSQMGSENKQADGITSMQAVYYNLDAQGRIMESASAASASLITTLLTMRGSGADRSYQFFSGARMRNRP